MNPTNDLEKRLLDEDTVSQTNNQELVSPYASPVSNSSESNQRVNLILLQPKQLTKSGDSTTGSLPFQPLAALSLGQLPVLDDILMFQRYWNQLSGTLTIMGYTQCTQFVNNDILNQKLYDPEEEKLIFGLLQATLSSKFNKDIISQQSAVATGVGSVPVATLQSLKYQFQSAKWEYLQDLKTRMVRARLVDVSKDDFQGTPFFVNFKKWSVQLKKYELDDEVTERQVVECHSC
ncbi:unnamed protein product [Ambrosiozyma monospora]|uniref:Unnamed protein product n=1 Tax=Ambrosiozyma monospora TaxID=43982 RepID=A0ACB5TWA9_AMBMO|nr:unnamed protein product [Ambrosiozyma monospora]